MYISMRSSSRALFQIWFVFIAKTPEWLKPHKQNKNNARKFISQESSFEFIYKKKTHTEYNLKKNYQIIIQSELLWIIRQRM